MIIILYLKIIKQYFNKFKKNKTFYKIIDKNIYNFNKIRFRGIKKNSRRLL